MSKKVYVDVLAEHRTDGQVLPRIILWPDGQRFEVDKILDIRPAASLKAGGAGIRYTCSIAGKRTYLFKEEALWFMEFKET